MKKTGAGTGTQTRGLFLGKEALYQLSYTRMLCDIYEVLLGSSSGGISDLIERLFEVRQVATSAELHPRAKIFWWHL